MRMSKKEFAAASAIVVAATLASVLFLGLWGIPIAAAAAYLVFRKRGTKAFRLVAFAIGAAMAIGGAVWLSLSIISAG